GGRIGMHRWHSMVRVWDAETRSCLLEIDTHQNQDILSVRFSPDGTQILSNSHLGFW
ncbi:hypothetical protein HYDPIDRAFT_84431, partial [Hydnomerulius pinastri MD-312]